jgi:hypothetical protein
MKQQTAVMSLLKKIYGENWSTNVVFQDFANKYLEMEKEQIKEAYNYGWDDRHHHLNKSWLEDADENYYNETYGQ